MTMVQLILLLLAICGAMITFVHMEIMDIIKLRPLWERVEFFKKLFHCSACTGWHVGLWYGVPVSIIAAMGYSFLFNLITLPFAASAICFLYERVSIFFDLKDSILEKEIDKED